MRLQRLLEAERDLHEAIHQRILIAETGGSAELAAMSDVAVRIGIERVITAAAGIGAAACAEVGGHA